MITPEQARAELQRRQKATSTPVSSITPEQARAELEKRRLQQSAEQRPGIIRQIAGSITRPFERLGATALQTGGGAVAFGIDRLTPNALTGGKNVYSSMQDAISRTPTGFDKVSATRALTGETPQPARNLRDVAGLSLEAASNVLPVSKAPALFGNIVKGQIGRAALTGGITAGTAGLVGGTGRGLQEDRDIINSLEKGVSEGIIAAPIGVALGGLGAGLVRAPRLATKTGREQEAFRVATEGFAKDLDEVLAPKAVNTRVRDLERRNVPIRQILQEPQIAQGIKVQDKTIVVDDALSAIQKNLDNAANAKSKLLPEVDRFVPPTSREEIRQRALREIYSTATPKDEKALIKAINEQIDELDDNLSLTKIDELRRRFRKSGTDAKGVQKSDSEYVAVENALRNILFEKTEKLPEVVDMDGSIRGLNTYIRGQMSAQEFLDKTLRGQKVNKGRLGEYFARGIGAVAGSEMGVLGAIAGSEIAGYVSNVLTNNALGSSVKMRLIQEAAENTSDPAVIRAANELIEKLRLKQLPALPARSSNLQSQVQSRGVIPLGASTVDELPAQNIGQGYLMPNMSRQNTANAIVTKNANTSIPQSLPPQRNVSSELSTTPLSEELINASVASKLPPRRAELMKPNFTPELNKNIEEIIDVQRGIKKVSPQKAIELEADMTSIIEDFGFAIPSTKAARIRLLERIYNQEI